MPHQAVDPTTLGVIVEKLSQLNEALRAQQTFVSKWLPSLSAFTAALVTLIVGLLSSISVRRQIKTAQETAMAQIASAKEIAVAQIRADLIAASRKEWIENLRNKIALFFSLMNEIHSRIATGKNSDDKSEEGWQADAYIELMLNPTEKTHARFLTKQAEFASFCMSGNKDIKKWAALKMDYLSLAQEIFKEEWEKVKKFS